MRNIMKPDEFSRICEEYDTAPDDFAWDKDHPIFQLAEENDVLKNKMHELKTLAKAYPAGVFIEPDWEQVRSVLHKYGISLDSVSGSNMRVVAKNMLEIIEA